MQLRRTLLLALILSMITQLWVAGASFAATGGPVKVSSYPADNDVAVPANAALKLVFDENVKKGSSGTVAIKEASTNVAKVSLAIGDGRISVSGNTVQINYAPTLLDVGVSYYVEISPNAFLNVSNNVGYAGITDATEWNFTAISPDSTRPTATLYPVSPATIPSTGALVMNFSEPVFAASGYVSITRTGTTDTQLISVLSPAVQNSGTSTITIQPPTRLVSGQTYQVTIDNNAFVDVVGNAYIPTGWTFATSGSVVATPSLFPLNAATNVAIGNLTAQMTFAGPMQKGTGNIQLKRLSDNLTVDTVSVQSADVTLSNGNATVNVAFVGPGTALEANKSYYILVDPGALLDASNNVYEGIIDTSTWSFMAQAAADTAKPTVLTLTPASGGSMTAINGSLTIKFNEPVKVGSGSIVIQRTSAPAGVFCTIPVTSGAITGSGTDTLAITPSSASAGCGSFAPNAQYSIQISNTAISDLAGNFYAGNSGSSWTIRISSDAVAPELVSTSPVPGTQTVPTTGTRTFTMQFSEAIDVPTGLPELYPSTGLTVTPIVRDATDSRKATFTVTGLAAATSYVVRIPNDAIQDLAGNAFPGILNDYRWTFKTIGSDLTKPQFTSAALDGNSIVLVYNEELDATSVPLAGNYYVTVNGVPRQVNAVTVTGSTVRLTLSSGIVLGQLVKISYTVGLIPLKDLSGNTADLLNAQSVTNNADTTLPRPVSGTLNGAAITLTFNKALLADNTIAPYQFTVKAGGTVQSISSVIVSGSTVMIYYYGGGTNSQSVSVSYTPGAQPLRDSIGNAAAAFADFYVQNSNDAIPPQLMATSAGGNTIQLQFNEGLLTTSVPSTSSFSIVHNGSVVVVSSVSVSSNTVNLTLSQALVEGKIAYVTYVPTSPGIVDLASNPAASINSYPVSVSGSAATLPVSASVSDKTITLVYATSLNSSTTPVSTQYYARANNSYIAVTGVSVQGTQVRLTLASPVAIGQTVTLTYNTTGIALKDTLNQTMAAFTDRAVTNTGASVSNLPDYLQSDGEGGVRFIEGRATTTEFGTTPAGRVGTRYVVDATKLLAAYDVIRAGSTYGITKPVVSVKVPSTETAAQVIFPISTLMSASVRAPNASLRVELGDVQFTVPLTAINYAKEVSLANAEITSARLLLTIDRTQDSTLSSQISAQGAQLLATPVDFDASVLYQGRERAIDNYETYVTRTFKLSSFTGSIKDVAVVRYDKDANQISYVPTLVTQSGSTATVDFKRKSNSVYTVVRYKATYTDTTTHWAKSIIEELSSKLIVDGPTRTTFAPNKNITRADFAEYIARGLGLTGDKAAGAKFSDVSSDSSYAAYIGAVSKAGIVKGDTSGTFRPNASITREEMATMLVKAMTYAGVSTISPPSALNGFKDKNKISSWAMDGMAICVASGLIKGATTTTLNPRSNATRAEATVMLQRFLEYAELL